MRGRKKEIFGINFRNELICQLKIMAPKQIISLLETIIEMVTENIEIFTHMTWATIGNIQSESISISSKNRLMIKLLV